MIQKILIFFFFLAPLIIFHELGHYLMARLFGVRVEVFSLGFGPKLLKFKKGCTEYAFSLIPLGGYVKMFGEDPFKKDEITEEERKFSFNHKGRFARFCIVFGGPLANFILAFFLFFTLLLVGEQVPELRLGHLDKGSHFYEMGLRSGDKLIALNDKEVLGPTDLSFAMGKKIEEVSVERGGINQKIKVSIDGMNFLERFSSINFLLRKPLLVDSAGKVYSVALSNSNIPFSLDELEHLAMGKTLLLFDYDLKKQNKSSEVVKKSLPITGDFFKQIIEEKLYPLDLLVKSVSMNSPADKAGVVAGDIILSLNNEKVLSFEELRVKLQAISGPVLVELLHQGSIVKKTISPEIVDQDNVKAKVIGVYTSAIYEDFRFVSTASRGLWGSFIGTFPRMLHSITSILDSLKKLVTNEVSFKNVGGPLSIGKVASDSYDMSLSYFFQIMAIISIHLGIINLFPIPVLDGGHIMFIVLEIINRGPISRRKLEIAQQIGFACLLFLMFAALFNDFVRFF